MNEAVLRYLLAKASIVSRNSLSVAPNKQYKMHLIHFWKIKYAIFHQLISKYNIWFKRKCFDVKKVKICKLRGLKKVQIIR